MIENKHRTQYEGASVTVEYCTGGREDYRDRRGGSRDRGERFRTQRTRIYVTGLPSSTSWQDLKDIFRGIPGEVGFVRVDSRYGPNEALGVLDYIRAEDAEEAIKKVDGTKFENSEGSTTMTVSNRALIIISERR